MYNCVLFVCFFQKLYYVQESHGIVVTDLAFLPHSLKGKNIERNNEIAMLSVAVDSRCQIHTVAHQSKSFTINQCIIKEHILEPQTC